jgi:hypothetical protein
MSANIDVTIIGASSSSSAASSSSSSTTSLTTTPADNNSHPHQQIQQQHQQHHHHRRRQSSRRKRSKTSPTATGVNSLDDSEYDPKVPYYLEPSSRQREFIKLLVDKFGLELARMGAASLMYRKNWRRIEFSLAVSGIDATHVAPLRSLCWLRIRACVGSVRFQERVDQLPLPTALKQFLVAL